MAKKGMARPERTHVRPRNDESPVPEIQGKARSKKEKARPIVEDGRDGPLRVFHRDGE